MHNSRHHGYRPLAACLLFAAALAVIALAAGPGQAQSALVRPKALPADAIVKKSDSAAAVVRPSKKLDLMTTKNDLNSKVLQYAESKMSQQVGRGECWDLGNEALKAAGAKQPGQSGYGSYVFGQSVSLSSIKPGDILQFEGVITFKHTSPNGSWSTQTFGNSSVP